MYYNYYLQYSPIKYTADYYTTKYKRDNIHNWKITCINNLFQLRESYSQT